MTKRKVAEFNLSAAVREQLSGHPDLTAGEAMAAIQAQHPGWKANQNSFSVAFYTARKRMRGSVKPGRAAKAPVSKKAPATASEVTALQMTRTFASSVGGLQAAMNLLDVLAGLQLGE